MAKLRVKARYRNKSEEKLGNLLDAAGVSFEYEPRRVSYVLPDRKYTPDYWSKTKSGEFGRIVIEYKGYFRKSGERTKLLHVRNSNPGLDIRIVFSNASKTISKQSSTTYGEWATENGFKWADKSTVPQDWIEEMKGQTVGYYSDTDPARTAKRGR